MTLYPEHRYDDHGQLRPPLWFLAHRPLADPLGLAVS